jgi:hypothetical protein
MVLTNMPTHSELLPTSIPPLKSPIIDTETEELVAPAMMESTNEESKLIFPMKVPLVSFRPVLATAPNFILTNECTKRRNRFVLFDNERNKSMIPSSIDMPVLDALWVEHHQEFLILTEKNIYRLDPLTKSIQVLTTIKPKKSKIFKCFMLLDQAVLHIAYDEWNTIHLDRWQATDQPGAWERIEKLNIQLTENEIIDQMSYFAEGRQPQIAISIFNQMNDEWRIEFRHPETFQCIKKLLLPGSDLQCTYRMIALDNNSSDVHWLIYSAASNSMIALNGKWEKSHLDYANPVQRMAIFAQKYLVVRTLERVDIHHFA